MGKIYLEQVLEQLVDKANVIVQTRDSDYAPTYCLGNHYAARWRLVLEQKFPLSSSVWWTSRRRLRAAL